MRTVGKVRLSLAIMSGRYVFIHRDKRDPAIIAEMVKKVLVLCGLGSGRALRARAGLSRAQAHPNREPEPEPA